MQEVIFSTTSWETVIVSIYLIKFTTLCVINEIFIVSALANKSYCSFVSHLVLRNTYTFSVGKSDSFSACLSEQMVLPSIV